MEGRGQGLTTLLLFVDADSAVTLFRNLLGLSRCLLLAQSGLIRRALVTAASGTERTFSGVSGVPLVRPHGPSARVT
jgi:hypothetical protein